MDCYDEILKISHENDRLNKCRKYLTDLINKKSKFLTELQFKNCIILTLAIMIPELIDVYSTKGKEKSELDDNEKERLIELLKSEYENKI